MKSKLLKKCRKSIMILNNQGFPAQRNDKRVSVVRFGILSFETLLTSKKEPIYHNYGNAIIKRRREIIELARELNTKPWYYFIFH